MSCIDIKGIIETIIVGIISLAGLYFAYKHWPDD